MAKTEQEWADLGRRWSTSRLIEQADATLPIARKLVSQLEPLFTSARLDEMQGYHDQIVRLAGDQAGQKTAAATANHPVVDSIAKAKAWISRARTIAASAFDDEPDVLDEFSKGGKVGQSVPRILAAITSILGAIRQYREPLRSWGLDDAKVDEGSQILEALRGANAQQEETVQALPSKTRDLNIAKGKLYELLKKLARVGRDVFKDDPATAKQLSLDILKRRGGQNPAEETPPADEPDDKNKPVGEPDDKSI